MNKTGPRSRDELLKGTGKTTVPKGRILRREPLKTSPGKMPRKSLVKFLTYQVSNKSLFES